MFLKPDSLLHNITSAGKLFRVTGAAYVVVAIYVAYLLTAKVSA